MIATAPPTTGPKPSVQKYGSIINEDGFTQLPRSVEEYLLSLKLLCSTEILLIIILLSHRWTPEQEFYPSVKTLAQRCGVSVRRINQMTRHLVALGLLIKVERFAGRSQISNYYDLEPLIEKVAAWKNPEVAAQLAQEEAQADDPFEPQDVLEQSAQIVSEAFGEPEPRKVRYNARRIARRWNQSEHLTWDYFVDIIEKSMQQTLERKAEPTRTGRAFTKLVPYFFSALDYHLSKTERPAPVQQKPMVTTGSQPHKNKEQQPAQSQQKPAHQQPKKSGLLAERAAARKAAEAQGRAKVRAPETLRNRIEAAALTFRDKAVKSSVQRAANLMADARLSEQEMIDLVAEARAETSAATNIKARMPYFFSLLEAKICTILENSVQ